MMHQWSFFCLYIFHIGACVYCCFYTWLTKKIASNLYWYHFDFVHFYFHFTQSLSLWAGNIMSNLKWNQTLHQFNCFYFKKDIFFRWIFQVFAKMVFFCHVNTSVRLQFFCPHRKSYCWADLLKTEFFHLIRQTKTLLA